MTGASLSLAVPGGVATAAVLVVLAAGIVALGVRELRGEPSRARRTRLVALRAATALVALLAGVSPRIARERVSARAGRLAVLVDVSRSMAVRDLGAESRASRAGAMLEGWAGDRASSGVTVHGVGGTTTPTTLGGAGRLPVEDDTRLAPALREAAADDDVGAIVLVTDGADRGGLRAETLARLGVRVHVVLVGSAELRDDSIARVEADPVAFLRAGGVVRVVVRRSGARRGPIPVSLRQGDRVVREASVEVPENGEAAVELALPADALGRAAYTVSIPHADGDVVPENDERAFLVRVVRDRLRVLLVAGRPSWDERFVRERLARDPSIDLISFFILRQREDLTMSSPDELALIPFPTDELFSQHLPSFDVVIFQDFDYAPYDMAPYLPLVRDYVRDGGSFAMIGGGLSFASGGYDETAIADVLPVELPRSAGRDPSELVDDAQFRPEVVPELARHPLVALAATPAETIAAWRALPPCDGVNLVTALRGDAVALLVHPRLHSADGSAMPVLVAGTEGRGRVLALGVDSSWRWGFTAGGQGGDAGASDRFWDHTLRWLARDPALEPSRVETDHERYGPSARVRIDALLRDARYVAATGDARVSIVPDAGGAATASAPSHADGDGRLHAELAGPLAPGAYRVVVRAGTVIAETPFVVEPGGDELGDPRANRDLARAIASATSGTFVDQPEHAPSLSHFDTTRTRSRGVEETPLVPEWLLAAALVALFAAEWIVRRRDGYR